jgi:Tfp pilus assembly protein PilF
MKYRNIYLSAIRVGEFSWAENFINEFKKKLQKEDRQNIVSLAMAQLEFEKKEYESTLEYLKKISTDQLFYKVDVKILSLRSLYELGHYETVISTIESFRRMLNSNTSLTEQYRQKNLNFTGALNMLVKAKMDNDPEAAGKTAEKIKAYDMITNKNWLLKKTEEIGI